MVEDPLIDGEWQKFKKRWSLRIWPLGALELRISWVSVCAGWLKSYRKKILTIMDILTGTESR